jgi:hypothetical protein
MTPRLKLVLLAIFPLVCSLLTGCFPYCFHSLNSKEQRRILHWKMWHLYKVQIIHPLFILWKHGIVFHNTTLQFTRKAFSMRHEKLRGRVWLAFSKRCFICVTIMSLASFTSAFTLRSFRARFVEDPGLSFTWGRFPLISFIATS